MLAATLENPKTVKFPLGATPKIDGVRSTNYAATLYSRTFKPIPNDFTQSRFGLPELDGLDGELVVGLPTSPTLMSDTTSGVMSKEGEPDVALFVFDSVNFPDLGYWDRTMRVKNVVDEAKASGVTNIHMLMPQLILTMDQLEEYEESMVAFGYEGLILRSLNGRYKNGRSTLKEGGMLKWKRFADSEAYILDLLEGETNTNAKEVSELGYAKRSTAKAGMVPTGKLGSILMRDVKTGVVFNCSPGRRSAAEKATIWANREYYIGKLATYTHFPVGVKDKPRFPRFKALRHPDDM